MLIFCPLISLIFNKIYQARIGNIAYHVLEARRIGTSDKCGKGLCASLFVGFLNSGLAGKTLKSSHHERYLKPFVSCSCLFLFVSP